MTSTLTQESLELEQELNRKHEKCLQQLQKRQSSVRTCLSKLVHCYRSRQGMIDLI
ncbi:hypothetical protein VB834_29250 [Limnoraphis robusta Tam1]|uniref:Uncharacterized protein n=1 Tax=Limnoraphis robusta CCNP1315 TaxID=3110306 RepID=A0ABU5TW82_9CYAN|nr:hypothetical protein [Limnoraphis robusta]MEA5496003.1 hypothetical protein [Limnoraphis robusta BA-68 BA1]MEA5518916.1 hypothetical protein [Limnoraphis robusta CCNP1315]MEA5543123.1 hypothetical protein [Limnoraphis robusta Tam1]MEA5548446.1 hypothetical protein [Limnoraphis robusta CCNP1324]